MNNRVREIIKVKEENSIEIQKYKFTIKCLEEFLNVSDCVFVLEESINSLNRMKAFLEEIKTKMDKLFDIEEELDRELHNICTHDVMVTNYDQLVCPICGSWFWKSERITGKYVIDVEETSIRGTKLIQEYIKFLINFDDNDFGKCLGEFMESLEDKYDINILRR